MIAGSLTEFALLRGNLLQRTFFNPAEVPAFT